MFTRRGEENRPFFNLGEGGEKRHIPKWLWKQNRLGNFREEKLDQRDPFLHYSLPSVCLLWPSPCLHVVARKQIPIKSGLQGNEMALLWGKSYTNAFLFNLMAKPRVSMILRQRRWVLPFSADVWGGSQSGFWGDGVVRILLSSELKARPFIAYWKCPATQINQASLSWESLQWNGTAPTHPIPKKRGEKMLSYRK